MAEDRAVTIYSNSTVVTTNPFALKIGETQILRGGVILEVFNVEQAKIADKAGAIAVIISEPLRRGISRMTDPSLIKQIKQAVAIPIIARARVGHFVEAQILEAIGVDFIDESEVLGIADDQNYICKHNFRRPFICGSQNLGEAMRRIHEGASMIRIQGELFDSGNILKTVKNVRSLIAEIRALYTMDDDEVSAYAKKIAAPYDPLVQTKFNCRSCLPVVQYAAGGIVTPADAAMMMRLGCNGVFVGSEIFDCSDPITRIKGIVQAVRHYDNPYVLVETSSGLSAAMARLNVSDVTSQPSSSGSSR